MSDIKVRYEQARRLCKAKFYNDIKLEPSTDVDAFDAGWRNALLQGFTEPDPDGLALAEMVVDYQDNATTWTQTERDKWLAIVVAARALVEKAGK